MKLNKILLILYFLSGSLLADTSSLILTSDADGMKWTQQQSSLSSLSRAYQLNLISQYKNNLMITGAEVSFCDSEYYSVDDGVNWNDSSLQYKPETITGLAVNSHGWVITGNTRGRAKIAFTGDIDNWKGVYIASNKCNDLKKINELKSNDSTFLALISCRSYEDIIRPSILMSSNGYDWVKAPAVLPPEMQNDNANFNKAYWDGKQWFIIATKSDNTPILYTTTDLKTLNPIILPAEINSVQSIATNNDEWVATGTYENAGTNAAAILISTNKGSSWTLQKTFPVNIVQLNKIIRNDTNWIAVGSAGQVQNTYPIILTSKEGTNWQQATLPVKVLGASQGATINDVTWDGKKWIAVGNYDQHATGCLALNKISRWKGTLSDNTIVTEFAAYINTSKKATNSYEVNGWIQYDNNAGKGWMLGTFVGTCNEHDDGSIDFGMSMNGGYYIAGTRKSPVDLQLTITDSRLASSAGNGTLTPKDTALSKIKGGGIYPSKK